MTQHLTQIINVILNKIKTEFTKIAKSRNFVKSLIISKIKIYEGPEQGFNSVINTTKERYQSKALFY